MKMYFQILITYLVVSRVKPSVERFARLQVQEEGTVLEAVGAKGKKIFAAGGLVLVVVVVAAVAAAVVVVGVIFQLFFIQLCRIFCNSWPRSFDLNFLRRCAVYDCDVNDVCEDGQKNNQRKA